MKSALSLFGITIFVITLQTVEALYCYRCVSSQPGCGRELSIRIERWHTCEEPGEFGGENFCVKVIEKIGSDEVITRECLSTMRRSERHREWIPTIQRHNYCEPARNNDPKKPYDYTKTFCFCNDWNGCNTAAPTIGAAAKMLGVITSVVAFTIVRWSTAS